MYKFVLKLFKPDWTIGSIIHALTNLRVSNWFSASWTTHLEVYLKNNPSVFGLQVASSWVPTETLGNFWAETYAYLHLWAWERFRNSFIEKLKIILKITLNISF